MVFAFAACDIDDAAVIEKVELGAMEKSYVAEAAESTVDIQILSNGPFHIENVEGETTEWLTLSSNSGSGDQTITAYCDYNEEFKRMATLKICSDVDSRIDTIQIKQKGMIEAALKMENTSVIADGKGGVATATVSTNVPFEYMDVVTTYSDTTNAGWITDARIDGTTMSFTTEANTDPVVPRVASVDFSFTDGWGDKVAVLVNLVQRNSKEGLGRQISISEFKQGYATGKPVEEYVIIEGRVVSNRESGNAGENEQTTTSAIDYTGQERTVYLQTADGSEGLALICNTADDNVFSQYDLVQVLVQGATGVLHESPERCEIKGVTKAMVVSQIKGSKSDIPVKEKHLCDLTDKDIYTYVTLMDVEIPVRKGSLTPVNEGYALGTNAHRISKYPRLIRDINGDTSYLMTNTKCAYRSDGTRLPYGSGKISGVIVHERFSRFEWRDGADPLEMEDDPTLGFIGNYQIRHQSKEDVWGQMNDSVEDSFSGLLAEYRWWYPDMENEVCRPSYGENGWFTCTYQEKYTGSASKSYTQATYKQHMWGSGNYAYLGPTGNNASYYFGYNVGNKNGLGIVIDPAKEHYCTDNGLKNCLSYNPDGTLEWAGPYAEDPACGYGSLGWSAERAEEAAYINAINFNGSTSMRGKGNAYGGTFNGWASNFWWDSELQRGHAWMINFSAKGLSTSHLSLQISVLNTQQDWYSCRYWKAEYSTVSDSMDPKDDVNWHLLKEYTIPDVSVWANTLYSSIVAYKHINFDLPLELLDQENVYIRLMPTSDICSDGAEYANARYDDKTVNANHSSAIEYIAIRYNK